MGIWALVSMVGCNADGFIEATSDSAQPILDTAAAADEADVLETLARDVRVDPTLARMLLIAARREREAGPITPEITGAPANLDPSTAHRGSWVELFIEGAPDISELEANGAAVRTVAGEVMTASAELASIEALLAVPGVTGIMATRRVEIQSDVSVPETGAPEVWGGESPDYGADGLTGRDVIIGIVDPTSVYAPHEDLLTDTGSSRILYHWDQTWSGGPPAGYAYGTERTGDQILSEPYTGANDAMEGSHGTHLAGIAAGNGQATGNGYAAYRHVGVAPEADIIAVKSYDLEGQVVDAVNYIFTKADDLDQTAVVNLSIGSRSGAHDGTSSMDKALSALVGPGKIITACVGNEGDKKVHAATDLGAGDASEIEIVIPTYTPSTSQTEYVLIEGWVPAGAAFDLQLVAPNGTAATEWIEPSSTSDYVETTSGTVLVSNAVQDNGEDTSSARYASKITVQIAYGTPGTARPAAGTWRLELDRRSEATSGRSDFWMTDSYILSATAPSLAGTHASSSTTILSPATGDKVIATGAYATKYRFANLAGSTTNYPSTTGLPTGRFASFSSRGPRRDGVQRPDVVAPGYGVLAARSFDYASDSATYLDPDGQHVAMKGTSQASAHTAGVVALLLQETCPDGLSGCTQGYEEIQALLTGRAVQDEHTQLHPCPDAAVATCPYLATNDEPLSVPNDFYGYGKLSVLPRASAPDASRSLVENILLGSPNGIGHLSVTGDAETSPMGFQITVRDAAGQAVPAVDVQISFAAVSSTSLRLASSTTDGSIVSCAGRTLTKATGSDGKVTFYPRFGGYSNTANVVVSAAGVSLENVKARSLDNLRAGSASLANLVAFTTAFNTSGSPQFDFDMQGSVGLGDYTIFAKEFLSGGSMSFCP